MPPMHKDNIKPVVIWTAVLTGVILSLVKVFGDGFLMTHDINVKYPYLEQAISDLKESHVACEDKMDMLIIDVHSHHNKMDVIEHRVTDCEDGLSNCEKAHRKYHHDMKE